MLSEGPGALKAPDLVPHCLRAHRPPPTVLHENRNLNMAESSRTISENFHKFKNISVLLSPRVAGFSLSWSLKLTKGLCLLAERLSAYL